MFLAHLSFPHLERGGIIHQAVIYSKPEEAPQTVGPHTAKRTFSEDVSLSPFSHVRQLRAICNFSSRSSSSGFLRRLQPHICMHISTQRCACLHLKDEINLFKKQTGLKSHSTFRHCNLTLSATEFRIENHINNFIMLY